jgi:hypothetical protein
LGDNQEFIPWELVGGGNLYNYVQNDSINAIDPFGLATFTITIPCPVTGQTCIMTMTSPRRFPKNPGKFAACAALAADLLAQNCIKCNSAAFAVSCNLAVGCFIKWW